MDGWQTKRDNKGTKVIVTKTGSYGDPYLPTSRILSLVIFSSQRRLISWALWIILFLFSDYIL